jgi:hypothetical protein
MEYEGSVTGNMKKKKKMIADFHVLGLFTLRIKIANVSQFGTISFG